MALLFAFALVLLAPPLLAGPGDAAPAYGSAAIVDRDGYAVLTVRGKPFFLWGAAFFYERIPRDGWRSSLESLRRLHVNTLDLYVPWNWHELSDGDFDFGGRTNPRRDLRGLLRLAAQMGFYLVVRPGPVIRNEWRNGGYPAWLLQRPEYGMPLHDVLEGRYPATATLQNQHSDDAAAEWMRNATHMRYAERWLRRALAEFAPVADRVVAIALDDDQGAYLSNQTWPAPHLVAYLHRLAKIVHAATSPKVPVFINTYQMQVPASSPVWAMGNWYQSDARAIGEHDRAQLAFSTALLGTRPHQPIVLSEFQAGWLLAPEDVYPRKADPDNTLLALHTALAEGARGAIDFPMQDTLAPAGWEAPFANWFYAWDAALRLDGRPSPRYEPTAAFGATVARDGPALALTHPVADAAIVWWTTALRDAPLSNDDLSAIADATIEAQRTCRTHELSCPLVDLRFADAATLRRYPALIVPRLPPALRAPARLDGRVRARLADRAKRGTLIDLADPDARAFARTVAARSVQGVEGATLHVGRDGARTIAFLDVVNFRTTPLVALARVKLGGCIRPVPVRIAPRGAALIRLDRSEPPASPIATLPGTAGERPRGIPLRRDVDVPAPAGSMPAGDSIAFARDLFGDGSPVVVLQNSRLRAVVSPGAGGRAFVLEDLAHRTNAFTTVGALRDDVSIQPPPSETDRIARYTHTFPAGTFNRPYRISDLGSDPARVTLTYDAPDIVPRGARFEKTLVLPAGSDTLEVSERFFPGPGGEDQRHVVITSLALGPADGEPWEPPVLLPAGIRLVPQQRLALPAAGPLAIFEPRTNELATVAWGDGAAQSAELAVLDRHVVLRLTLRPGTQATSVSYRYVMDEAQARARVAPESSEAAPAGGVAERSTQSPQKRPSESSCGFKSHLPHQDP